MYMMRYMLHEPKAADIPPYTPTPHLYSNTLMVKHLDSLATTSTELTESLVRFQLVVLFFR